MKQKYKLTLSKMWKHFCLINEHRWHVFIACCNAGMPFTGLKHDISKYSFAEFIESAKYYDGTKSPIEIAKEEKGYCYAWIHHKGRNFHHYEAWIDYLDDGGIPVIMPYKYAMEMVCDYIGAGKTYEKTKWTLASPENYWNIKKETAKVHPKLILFFDEIFKEFKLRGYSVLDRDNTYEIYQKIVEVK